MDEANNIRIFIIRIAIAFLVISTCLFCLFGCTLSFQNISTHGTASDLVDETQSNTPTISPNIEVPLKAL